MICDKRKRESREESNNTMEENCNCWRRRRERMMGKREVALLTIVPKLHQVYRSRFFLRILLCV